MKTNLGLRPIYVRLEDHIEGHVMSCVLALILIRLLQIRLRENNYSMSIDEIIEALKDANVLFIPNSKGKEVFVSESKYLDIYLDNDRRKQKEEKLIKSLRKEYILQHEHGFQIVFCRFVNCHIHHRQNHNTHRGKKQEKGNIQ